MTYGIFSDKRICLGLTHYLAERGATCWVMEWQGHGSSPPAAEQFAFETIALSGPPHRYLLAGRGGIAQGYRHGSIMLSRRAALEIWTELAAGPAPIAPLSWEVEADVRPANPA